MIPNLWRVPVLNPPPHCSPVGPVFHGPGATPTAPGCRDATQPHPALGWTLKLLVTDAYNIYMHTIYYIYKVLLGGKLKLLVLGWCQDQTAAVLVGEVICWECHLSHLSLRSGISPRPRLGHDSGDVSHDRCSVSSAGSTLNIGPVEN